MSASRRVSNLINAIQRGMIFVKNIQNRATITNKATSNRQLNETNRLMAGVFFFFQMTNKYAV
jgi:hypothetical protein